MTYQTDLYSVDVMRSNQQPPPAIANAALVTYAM